jgi:hypothetical protein
LNKKQAKRARSAAYKEAKRQDLWKKLEGYVFEKRWRKFLAWLFPKKKAAFEKWVAETYRKQLKSWSKEAYSQIHDKELQAFHRLQKKRMRTEAWERYNAEQAAWEAEQARLKKLPARSILKEIEEEEADANNVR